MHIKRNRSLKRLAEPAEGVAYLWKTESHGNTARTFDWMAMVLDGQLQGMIFCLLFMCCCFLFFLMLNLAWEKKQAILFYLKLLIWSQWSRTQKIHLFECAREEKSDMLDRGLELGCIYIFPSKYRSRTGIRRYPWPISDCSKSCMSKWIIRPSYIILQKEHLDSKQYIYSSRKRSPPYGRLFHKYCFKFLRSPWIKLLQENNESKLYYHVALLHSNSFKNK